MSEGKQTRGGEARVWWGLFVWVVLGGVEVGALLVLWVCGYRGVGGCSVVGVCVVGLWLC